MTLEGPTASRPTVEELLAFEADNVDVHRSVKAVRIRRTFGFATTGRYYLELHRAIDDPRAMQIDRELTLQLQREREESRVRLGLREPVTQIAGKQGSLFETGREGALAYGEGASDPDRPVSEGETRKVVGMALADQAADEAWKRRVDEAIATFAAAGEPFTAEDVRKVAGDPPSHPNAFGARFNAAARKRVIVRVGFREATRASLHRHPIALWVGASAKAAAS